MSFQSLFSTVVIATALIVGAFLLHMRRPAGELQTPNASFVRATGKCAECHLHETSAVVHEFEMSAHAAKNVNCLDCHRPVKGQESVDHRGFVIARHLSAANCRECHENEYRQFERSRHGAPAWAAVSGAKDFTAAQIAFSEKYHPGAVERAPNALAMMEGPAATNQGCYRCHEIGRPNADGSIGSCTACHARHASSVELARTPETCGQCHMGPDHSQLEIYHESKHGVLFNAQRDRFHLDADPKHLTTRDMPVPTCATCHMSGLEGLKVTHDTTERLSMFLFAPKSEKRAGYLQGVTNMQETCLKCHTRPNIEKFYAEAETVVASTNELVEQSNAIMKGLRDEKLLTPAPFDEPIEFLAFDLWHYGGRTAKHGAYMGGADFVQWHGFYELTSKLAEMKQKAAEIRAKAAETSR
ncbi:MAG: nitrate reductase [Planctomycetes bacterium]|nr:nitrate reductase [Planctomycetota bacterium]